MMLASRHLQRDNEFSSDMVGKPSSYGGAEEDGAEYWGVHSEMSAVITGLCQVPNVPSPSKKP